MAYNFTYVVLPTVTIGTVGVAALVGVASVEVASVEVASVEVAAALAVNVTNGLLKVPYAGNNDDVNNRNVKTKAITFLYFCVYI